MWTFSILHADIVENDLNLQEQKRFDDREL